jgi:hypothetical protein
MSSTNISTEFLIKGASLKTKKDIDKLLKIFLSKCRTDNDNNYLVKCYKSLIDNLPEQKIQQESVIVKNKLEPEDKQINTKRESINTRNIFEGKSFDINTFNNVFENIKASSVENKKYEYFEDMECYNFSDQFSNFQPIVEYAGIIVPDTEEHHKSPLYSDTYEIDNSLTLKKLKKPSNSPKDYSASSNIKHVRAQIKDKHHYNTVKEQNIRKEMEEKKRKVQKSLNLYSDQSPEELMSVISNYNPDKIIQNLTKGPFES